MNVIQRLAVDYLTLILNHKDPTKGDVKLKLTRYQLGWLHPLMMSELSKSERNVVYRHVSKLTGWKLLSKEESGQMSVTLVFCPQRQMRLELN